MLVAYSDRVARASWREEATAWIRGRLGERGITVNAVIAQPRIRPWSTQLAIPTDAGTYWFKANCAGLAFEAAVHARLAVLVPDEVDEPLAVDAGRGWMITRDRGFTLADLRTPTTRDWQHLLRAAARLQRRVAEHGPTLLAEGLPDCSPVTVPDRFDRMLAAVSGLPGGHPAALPPTVLDQLSAARPRLVEAAELLAASRLPPTLQHGDLHPGNAFEVAGGLRIFDFGDAQWAHPLELLHVPRRWVTQLTTLSWDPVLEAYVGIWSDMIDPDDMPDLIAAAALTQAVNRSMTWWDALAEAGPDEVAEWGEAPAHHLQNLTRPGA